MAAVGFAATAGAQTPAPASPSAPAAPASAAASGGAAVEGQVGFSRQAQVSPQDEMAKADAVLARLQVGSAVVSKQLGDARSAHDVVKVLCLNDKLSQMDVALRSAQDRKQSLGIAIQGKNNELANHEFIILTVLQQRGEQLSAEANQCIGEEAAFVGETQTTTTIDPNVPIGEETAYPPTDPIIISGPPLPTSSEK